MSEDILKRILTLFAVAAFALSGTAHAGSLSSSFQVRANVSQQTGCSGITVTPMDFGNLTATVTGNLSAATAQSQLTLYCTKGTPVTIALSAGNAGTESTATNGRHMLNAANNVLGYNIYIDTQNNGTTCGGSFTVWGDGTDGTLLEPWTATGNTTNLNVANDVWAVCGLLPAQPMPGTGAFVDTIVATLTF